VRASCETVLIQLTVGFGLQLFLLWGRGLFENNGSGDASTIGGGSMAGYESGVSGLTSMEEDR
jgi:hypothetical protein